MSFTRSAILLVELAISFVRVMDVRGEISHGSRNAMGRTAVPFRYSGIRAGVSFNYDECWICDGPASSRSIVSQSTAIVYTINETDVSNYSD